MAEMTQDAFGAQKTLNVGSRSYRYYDLKVLEEKGLIGKLETYPVSIRILMENILRNINGKEIFQDDMKKIGNWQPQMPEKFEIPFKPARVILQDFTGVPAVVDLAAMRSAMKAMGGDPRKINPHCPVDLVIDHSVQVDYYGNAKAIEKNSELEFSRNMERYKFLKWGQNAFDNFRVVPPATGIIHQVNLEFLAKGVVNDSETLYPDTLVGTDSHTTMINGLGVLGWGVGGIEAEAVMLGQPIYMVAPEVVGFRLHGELNEGVTATDLTLTIVEILRKHNVVEKFVEFFGEGLSSMTLEDRATIANMAPEYGATMGFFPVDHVTLDYLRNTGRSAEDVDAVEAYCKAQGLFRTDSTPQAQYTAVLELDLSSVEPSLAGPKRPQDRITLKSMKQTFRKSLTDDVKNRGFGLKPDQLDAKAEVTVNGKNVTLKHGSVVITAITSCTNTSNPSVLIAAGLVAKKAVERGLSVPAYVKTSLAPGSKVVEKYLKKAGLLESLNTIGFNIVGYGCTTCIGNSGPLDDAVAEGIQKGDLVASAVLSGNRNFEGRVNPHTRANFLASPPLVVAYALAGSTDIDLTTEAMGTGKDGKPVYLKDIWPTQTEIQELISSSLLPEMFADNYGNVWTDNELWNRIDTVENDLYAWDESSTYIKEPPFFIGLTRDLPKTGNISGARALAVLGDSVTTDHISPAGVIPAQGPAEKFLFDRGVERRDFNSFGSRRGNDAVMVRGTFANIRLKNMLVPGIEGGVTRTLPDNTQMSIYDASRKYAEAGTPLIVLAGKEYGTGSSRDWAAKGTLLLGVKAVIAESFERIHRSNLVGMGILPLVYADGETRESLGLSGEESYSITGLEGSITPRMTLQVTAENAAGEKRSFDVICRLDTPVEINYYKNGGILHTVLRNLAAKA